MLFCQNANGKLFTPFMREIMSDLPILSEKEARLVKEYFSNGGNPTEAYRVAFNSFANTASCSTHASRLLKSSKIIPWIIYYSKTLQEHIEHEIKYSVDDAFRECEEMKIIALETRDKDGRPNLAAANKALEMKIKLKGLIKEEKNALNNNIVAEMENIEIDGVPLNFKIGEDVEGGGGAE